MDQVQSRTVARAKDTGMWLTIAPSTSNGTALSALEWRDNVHLPYGLTPDNLPKCCDGGGQKFTIEHALQCKKGGLVIGRHEEVKEELVDLAAKAFRPSAI